MRAPRVQVEGVKVVGQAGELAVLEGIRIEHAEEGDHAGLNIEVVMVVVVVVVVEDD